MPSTDSAQGWAYAGYQDSPQQTSLADQCPSPGVPSLRLLQSLPHARSLALQTMYHLAQGGGVPRRSLFQRKPSGIWDSEHCSVSGEEGARHTQCHFCLQAGSPCDCLAKDRVDCSVSPQNSSMMTASVPREPWQEWSQISRGARSPEAPLHCVEKKDHIEGR